MDQRVKRRRFAQLVGSGVIVGIAGCTGDDGDDDDGSDDHDHNGDDGETETENGDSEGLIYAFAPNTIAVIDPEDGEVVDEITDGLDDEGWGDRGSRPTTEGSTSSGSRPQVLVIDTGSHEIVDEVDIGPDATHMYHPNDDDEMWAHSDEEGTFYVIDTGSHEVTEIVESGLENEGYGKLLYHEDIGSMGYATNVNDPAALIIDLEEYERTDYIELENEEGGTHYKAYAPETGLAYFEHGDETAVVDTEDDDLVESTVERECDDGLLEVAAVPTAGDGGEDDYFLLEADEPIVFGVAFLDEGGEPVESEQPVRLLASGEDGTEMEVELEETDDGTYATVQPLPAAGHWDLRVTGAPDGSYVSEWIDAIAVSDDGHADHDHGDDSADSDAEHDHDEHDHVADHDDGGGDSPFVVLLQFGAVAVAVVGSVAVAIEPVRLRGRDR